jgi:excisionase family DNA binding protein
MYLLPPALLRGLSFSQPIFPHDMIQASVMVSLSTEEVAKRAGISRVTLERWLSSGKVRQPKTIRFGKNEFRNWTNADVERVRKFKKENYREPRKKIKTKGRHGPKTRILK